MWLNLLVQNMHRQLCLVLKNNALFWGTGDWLQTILIAIWLLLQNKNSNFTSSQFTSIATTIHPMEYFKAQTWYKGYNYTYFVLNCTDAQHWPLKTNAGTPDICYSVVRDTDNCEWTTVSRIQWVSSHCSLPLCGPGYVLQNLSILLPTKRAYFLLLWKWLSVVLRVWADMKLC